MIDGKVITVPAQKTLLEKRLEKLILMIQDEKKLCQLPEQLEQLGALLERLFPEVCKNTYHFPVFFNHYCFEKGYNFQIGIYNPLIYQVFKSIWKEDSSAYPSKRKYQQYKVKAHLIKSIRHRIHLGLLALDTASIDQFRFTLQSAELEIIKKKIAYYDAVITNAIHSYATIWQTLLQVIGIGLAVAMGVASGLITFSAVAHLFIGTQYVMLLASIVGLAGCIVNIQLFKPAISGFLLNLLGRNSFADGFIHGFDSKGRRVALSFLRKLSLLGTLLLALASGIGYSIIVYDNLAHLMQILPYTYLIGSYMIIPLSVVSALCTTILLFNAMADILKNPQLKSGLSKPFEAIGVNFDPRRSHNISFNLTALKIAKWLCYGAILIFIIMTLAGLITLCSVSQLTLFKLLLVQCPYFSQMTLRIISDSIITLFFLAKLPFVCISTIRTVGILIAPAIKYLVQGITLGSHKLISGVKSLYRSEEFQLEIFTIRRDNINLPAREYSVQEETLSFQEENNQYFIGSFFKSLLFKYIPTFVNAIGHGALMVSPAQTYFGTRFSTPLSISAGILSFFTIIGRKEAQIKAKEVKHQASCMREEKAYQAAVIKLG